ncbi:DUF1634 domain-containing protein [Pararcticibacter amylolyticus]|uniref:DUF1634 domain-containing protein n=1 Tax=Pararcticibacter amylolyticus TaxID=2173175 RepID=A0A2U2PFJ6_9SPHI|nr:DUF1634 domain-containing protein [Pararcticibacter amylolyticus]PWG80177.1 DUF1634 domain-containing protein [Pararcticibacter amylolyticus]
MRNFFNSFSTDRDVAALVGKLLRTGVVTASIVAFIGGVVYLTRHGAEVPDYKVFRGAPENLRHFPGILEGVMSFSGAAIIQLGVVILLATPIVRIFFSAIAFAIEKDYLYVVITLIVLGIIVFGMVGGLGG